MKMAGLALAPQNVLVGGKVHTDAEEACCHETFGKGMSMGPNWECTKDMKILGLQGLLYSHPI
jgi:hypothetical protein